MGFPESQTTMAAADVQPPVPEPAAPEPAPAVPDYLASPNAVFNDVGVQWRYGKAPDYSKTRKVWEEGKKMNHAAGSLPQLVENLVKNWEVEASFKPRLEDWRTIDHERYSFAINGGPPQSGEHMLKVGTYNAIIAPNEYYSPENSDFASSHKTFKRMMPTFAWEVVEVYSGPPQVAFKWRHWGVMKNDYVGFNDKGEKVVAKAHGGPIEIFGVTVAKVDDKVRLQELDTWFDPLDMFRQIAPKGIVNKENMNRKVDPESALDVDSHYVPSEPKVAQPEQPNGQAKATEPAHPISATKPNNEAIIPDHDGVKIAEESNQPGKEPLAPEQVLPTHVSNSTGQRADAFVPHQGADTSKPTSESNPSDATTPATTVVESAATHGADATLEHPESNFHDAHEQQPVEGADSTGPVAADEKSPDHQSIYSSAVTGNISDRMVPAVDESTTTGVHDALDTHLESSSAAVHPHPHATENATQVGRGEAVAVPAASEETRLTHEEMSRISGGECPFLMNRE
ncbi:hypothetical protein D0867_13544 [Hortaea werneckii]|uniref:Pathogen-related protein n=2 Tax=Hortaea werneckii TaxID=91943 RepID=A0A3M6XXU5_HORWE|nr:hypothetical protein D0867_13544 [Hortaea werneckii]